MIYASDFDTVAQVSEIGSFAVTMMVLLVSVYSIVYYRETIALLAEGRPLDGARYRTLYRYWLALGTLTAIRGRGVRGEDLFDAARQRIEVEIIYPRPIPPDHATRKERKKLHKEWRDLIESKLVTPSHTAPTRIRVDSPMLLTKKNEYMRRYFEILRKQDSNQTLGFATLLEVDTGFIAPLHLLQGLIYRYDEDWDKIVDRYGDDIKRKKDDFRKLSIRRFQVFTFDCWLLWGPSIPLCDCEQWKGTPAVQFGYGDENNSLAVHGDDPKSILAAVGTNNSSVLAQKAHVTGALRWGPGVVQNDFCAAQEAIWNEPEGRIVLETAVTGGGVRAAGENAGATYYSAYIWIIFVMCDQDGKPFHNKTEYLWRDLIPFFIHGNIADPDTYDIQTDELARSAADSMIRLLDDNADLLFQFACAIDETACGASTMTPTTSRTIRDKMTTFIGEKHFNRIRLDFDPKRPFMAGFYSACHLNEIVHDYYADKPLDQARIAKAVQ